APLHLDFRHRRRARRARRRGHGADDLGDARHRRRGDRAGLRRRRHQRARQRARHHHRRPHRRIEPRRGGASLARGRALRHLRGDVGSADRAAARAFRPAAAQAHMSRLDGTIAALVLGAALLGGVSLALPDWVIFLATIIVAKALVVLGLLILWRTGLMSFGQALFYGVGGYAVGLAQLSFGLRDAFLLVLTGIVLAAVAALVLGFLLARYRDIFFAMLSLAFSMILYGTLVKSATLGSTDGFAILQPHFLRYAPGGAAALTHRYLASPLGALATAIRDNEIRVEYLGYSVKRAIHVSYVIAAALAGAGGGPGGPAVGPIDPHSTYWTSSGEFVFVTILSGAGSVLAPFLGSALFEILRAYAADAAPYSWQMILGVCLLLMILFLPQGVWSLFQRRARRRARRTAATP